ncbi:hypothetical protein CUR178_08328 [Leishmania enriettii]|uniref:Uncharacterized protein n=1 Tax=Leishmania enriettii TaxID=5663 RepID=A0A836GYJ4_LEIEN|nr:hypothetical protein CUR178_08328 [Leishmania enriettii]
MADRRTFGVLPRYGEEACGSGLIIAQLKMLAQGGSTVHSTTSVEQFKGAEFADSPPMGNSSSSEKLFKSSLPLPSLSSTPVSERSALRAPYPATAAALDCMESHCVWMDYCCNQCEHFQRNAWQPVCHGCSSLMPSSTPRVNVGGTES